MKKRHITILAASIFAIIGCDTGTPECSDKKVTELLSETILQQLKKEGVLTSDIASLMKIKIDDIVIIGKNQQLDQKLCHAAFSFLPIPEKALTPIIKEVEEKYNSEIAKLGYSREELIDQQEKLQTQIDEIRESLSKVEEAIDYTSPLGGEYPLTEKLQKEYPYSITEKLQKEYPFYIPNIPVRTLRNRVKSQSTEYSKDADTCSNKNSRAEIEYCYKQVFKDIKDLAYNKIDKLEYEIKYTLAPKISNLDSLEGNKNMRLQQLNSYMKGSTHSAPIKYKLYSTDTGDKFFLQLVI